MSRFIAILAVFLVGGFDALGAKGMMDPTLAMSLGVVISGALVEIARRMRSPAETAAKKIASGGILFLVCFMPGCAQGGLLQNLFDHGLSGAVQQYGPDVVAGAQMICAGKVAEQRRISVEEAVDTVCNTLDAVEPFIPLALDTKSRALADRSLRVPE